MRKLFYLFIIFLPFFLNSCDKEPYVHIYTETGSKTFGVGENVQFASDSYDAYEYVWDFGDGTVARDRYMTTASHRYASPGNYTVKLTVYSERGKKSASETLRITILGTGDVTFWMSQNWTGGHVRVVFLGQTDYITHYYSSGTPNCGATGCACFNNCPPGTYHFYAENDDYYWEGNINVYAGYCNKMRLSISSKGEASFDDEGLVSDARVKEN
ncbi:MAG: PKD domain-containing protein [Bacteroidales bacterium]|nr:PKD domain-containing protein [Bacteroidales bacterium]